MQKVGGLKYSAPNINVYVLMVFTGFSPKSVCVCVCVGGGLAPPDPLFHLLCTYKLPLLYSLDWTCYANMMCDVLNCMCVCCCVLSAP